MLVLSRKHGEKIHIGDEIVLEVRKVQGDRVTIGIEAPSGVRILRGELVLRAQAESSDGSLKLSLGDLVRQARQKLGADAPQSSAS